MSANRLRAAARVLRHHANAATPGPWGVGNDTIVAQNMEQVAPGRCRYTQKVAEPNPWDYEDALDDEHAEEQARFDADHIAMMHPGVALAFADLLDAEAAFVARWPGHEQQSVGAPEAFRVADLILEGAS